MIDRIFNVVLKDTSDLDARERVYRLAGFLLITIQIILNATFAVVSKAKGLPEMAMLNASSAVIGVFNICLYLTKGTVKRNIASSLVIWNSCYYIIGAAILLGTHKNTSVLFPFVILATYGLFSKKTKYLIINSIVILITFILFCYIKYYVYEGYLDNTAYIYLINDLFAICGTIGFLYFKEIAEKYVDKHRDMKINSLTKEASVDYLTGLKNRRYARKYVLDKTNRKNDFIVICDIDFFKKVNDTYGHVCGDYVLKEIAKILKHAFRTSDLVCRWGGEEFLIYINKTEASVIEERLEQVRLTIEEKVFSYDEKNFNVTMTFGYSEIDENIEIEDNLKNADDALYYGKKNGRNKVVNFNDLD